MLNGKIPNAEPMHLIKEINWYLRGIQNTGDFPLGTSLCHSADMGSIQSLASFFSYRKIIQMNV